MKLKKHMMIVIAAAALATPAAAATQPINDYAPQERSIIAILIGLLIPAVQSGRG